MEFEKLIQERHSVRDFSAREVPREVIDRMVEAAMTAPSSHNTRSTGFMIVEDASTLEAISQMRTSGSAFVSGAKAAIVVLGDTSKTDLWIENCAISTTLLMLSATDNGLGSCWVHVHGRLRDRNNPGSGLAEDYLRNLLGIKENMGVLCVLALGYPKEQENI